MSDRSDSESGSSSSRSGSDDDDKKNQSESEDNDSDDSDDSLNRIAGARNKRRAESKKAAAPARAKRRKAQPAVTSLFEEEADVDDDEEDEYEEERFHGEKVSSFMEEEVNERYLARAKERQRFEDADVEDIAKKLQKRHAQRTHVEWEGGDGDLPNRNAFLPTVTDPKLFCVKCKHGEERMLVLQLMNKYRSGVEQGRPPKMHSALWGGTKGYIYLEAKNLQHVQDAVNGIRGIFRSKISMVPMKEMPTVLRIINRKKILKVDDFVRLRRFPYKGDLARIVNIDSTSGKVCCKYVPRIDFKEDGLTPEEKKEYRAKKIIPPPRFFNVEEVRANGGESSRAQYDVLGVVVDVYNENFYQHGYRLSEFNERMIQTRDVNPTVEELQFFRKGKKTDGDEDEDVNNALEDGAVLEEFSSAMATGDADASASSKFKKGDVVVVRTGELENLKGEVVAVGVDGVVKMNPLEASVRGNLLDFDAGDLMKVFEDGDHIKVRNGRYAGETGTVVKILEEGDRWKAIVFTDNGSREIVVFIDDMQISAEISQDQENLKGFKRNDLVSLGNSVGIVVKVGTELLSVMDQSGTIRQVNLAQLRGKLNNKSRQTTAMDKMRNTIGQNNHVRVVAGENAGIEAEIKHIHRSFLFLYSQAKQGNKSGGIFVERARNVQIAGIKLRNAQGIGSSSSSSSSFGTNFSRMAGGRGPRRGANDDALIGKTVRVKKGRFKGYLGEVVSATDEKVKVEFHSRKKTKEFDREWVMTVGDVNGRHNTVYGGREETAYGYGGVVAQTPVHNATPGRQNDHWNPGTPKPEDNDNSWGAHPADNNDENEEEDYRAPPTPAAFGAAASAYGAVQTPAAVPQTPSTMAVPKTPAAPGMGGGGVEESHGFANQQRVVFIDGPHTGATGRFLGVDGNDAMIEVAGDIKIAPLTSIQ